MNRDFKGVWIPKEIYLDKRLNALEKIILVEIDSLDDGEHGCYASNQYLAEFCQCSQTKVSAAISKLIECGYIESCDFDGRRRILKSSLTESVRQPYKICKADLQNVAHNNIDINKVNKIDNDIYSQIVNSYNSICMSLPKCIKLTDKRKRMLKKRLEENSYEDIVMAFRKAEDSEFLSGRNGKWQACNFDWFIGNPDNIVKTLEGKYDDKPQMSREDQEFARALNNIRSGADGDEPCFGE